VQWVSKCGLQGRSRSNVSPSTMINVLVAVPGLNHFGKRQNERDALIVKMQYPCCEPEAVLPQHLGP
jgi:hypothetical protein